MARMDDDENLDDQKITLSENTGVDKEDLRAPETLNSDEEDPQPRKTAEPEEENEEEQPSEPEERELHEPRRVEKEEPIEEFSRTTYPSRQDEDFSSREDGGRPEHTLNDLAQEEPEMSVPTGVDPRERPKSFRMAYEEDDDQYGSNIPHIGSQYSPSGVYANRGEPPRKGGGFKMVLLLIIAIVVLGGAVYLLKGKSIINKLTSSSPTPTPSPIVENATPSPSPTPSFDRSQYTIDILNGSGKTGLAASISGQLTNLGYKSGKVGNATNSAFQRTQVLVKSGDDELLQNLIKDLSPNLDATDGGLLKDSATSDGEVIIGAK